MSTNTADRRYMSLQKLKLHSEEKLDRFNGDFKDVEW